MHFHFSWNPCHLYMWMDSWMNIILVKWVYVLYFYHIHISPIFIPAYHDECLMNILWEYLKVWKSYKAPPERISGHCVSAQAIYQEGTKYAFAWLHFHSGPIINVMMNHWFWAVRSNHYIHFVYKHNDFFGSKLCTVKFLKIYFIEK